MSNIETKSWILHKLYTFLWINQKFHKYSESSIDTRLNRFIAPCDGSIHAIWEIGSDETFISKNNKKVPLTHLFDTNKKIFTHHRYINIYLSPRNRHFFVMPYDGNIIDIIPKNGKARIPILLAIETLFHKEVFPQAIIYNASNSVILQIQHEYVGISAIGSLNVNHITITATKHSYKKKGELLWYFSLGSSLILFLPLSWNVEKQEKDSVILWEAIATIPQ